MNNNTRRFPRTTVEAFPCTPEYGCAITRTRRGGHRIANVAVACAFVYLVAALACGWLA